MKVSIGSDHHGVLMRLKLAETVRQFGHDVAEHGPLDENTAPVDYPNVAIQVAYEVSTGSADRGILICGTGIGMCITANKFPCVRAATIIDELTAEISRRHNDVNVICLSGDMISEKAAHRLLEIWLNTPFDGGRHLRRLEKISQIEQILSGGGNIERVMQIESTCHDSCD